MDRKIKAILIDDEHSAISSLTQLLTKHCPDVEVIASSQSPEDGIQLIDDLNPDVLFLDIAMPTMDGFELLKNVDHRDFHLVFTTAHDEFAVQAIKEAALDYLLKPIAKSELIQAVEKIRDQLDQHKTEEKFLKLIDLFNDQHQYAETLGIPTHEGLEFIEVNDISYCKSDGNYTEVHLTNGKTMVLSKKIKHLESKLTPNQFVRVHHSYIVNLKQVKKYLRGRGGTLIMKNEAIIPVSVRKKNSFLDSM